jgi:hypothetical protein
MHCRLDLWLWCAGQVLLLGLRAAMRRLNRARVDRVAALD